VARDSVVVGQSWPMVCLFVCLFVLAVIAGLAVEYLSGAFMARGRGHSWPVVGGIHGPCFVCFGSHSRFGRGVFVLEVIADLAVECLVWKS
jgi:hypothetical protein